MRGALVALGSVASMLAAPAHAVVVDVDANADAYIRTGNTNFGSETFLRIRDTGNHRTLVRFDQADVVAAVAGGNLLSATLELYVENTTNWGPGRSVDIHRVTADWTETGVTFNCPNDTNTGNGSADCPAQWNGGTFVATPTDTYVQTSVLTGTIQLDVTADVAAFLAGTPNYGWLIKKTEENQNGLADYTSREGAVAAQRPRLVIDVFVPPTNTPTTTPTSTPTETPTGTPTETRTPTHTPTPDPNCPAQPLVGCKQSVQANKSLLLLKDRGGLKDKLIFKWIKGEQTEIAEFGDPAGYTTNYALCIYDQTSGVSSLASQSLIPGAGSCGGKPCWKETGKGFRYKDGLLLNDGIKVITLKSGASGKAKIVLKGQGSNLNLPALPLTQDQQVIAQLKHDEGECWEARFSGPPKKNESDQFKDKADPAITFPPTATATATATDTPAIVFTTTPTSTPTSTPTGPTATPTATPSSTETPEPSNCGNGFLQPGEFYDDPDVGDVGDLSGDACPQDAQVSACTPSGTVSVRVDLIPAIGTQPTAATILVGYQSDLVSLPAAKGASAASRVVWPAPLPFIRNATDLNYAVRILTVRTDGPIDTDQQIFTINFDGCSGQPLPDPLTDFGCIVEGCSGQGGPIPIGFPDGCYCEVSAP